MHMPWNTEDIKEVFGKRDESGRLQHAGPVHQWDRLLETDMKDIFMFMTHYHHIIKSYQH